MTTLYLMMGYPGSGKTTTARIIHDQTNAIHLWADQERHQKFTKPTHDHAENLELYADLNHKTDELLSQGHSVIFDTNFNFRKDRIHLNKIAQKNNAKTVLVWVRTPLELAKKRATTETRNSYNEVMPTKAFDRMSANLEKPGPDEDYVEIDGTQVTPDYVKKQLGI